MISPIRIDQAKPVCPMFPETMDKDKELSGDNGSRYQIDILT